MKKLFMIAAAATLAACSSDNGDIQSSNGPQIAEVKQPIMLGSAITPGMRSNSQTLQSDELEADTEVGVYIYFAGKQTTDNTYNYGYKNISYKVSGAVGDLAIVTAADQPYYPDKKNQAIDIYAFAPRVYTGTDELTSLDKVNDFSTKQDQTAEIDYRASDFTWGVLTNQTAPPDATTKKEVKMYHKLSKVNINIAAGKGMTPSHLAGATIKLNGVKLDGTIKLTDGTVTLRDDDPSASPAYTNEKKAVTLTSSTAQTKTITITGAGDINGTYNDAYTSSAVIIPQEVPAADNFIEVKLADIYGGSTYKYKTTAATIFKAKEVTTYNIVLSTAGIQITTTINNWTAGGTTSGTAE